MSKNKNTTKQNKIKQFKQIGFNKKIITQSDQLYNFIIQHSLTIKNVKSIHPKYKEYQIIDFSLNTRGTQQDQIYLKYPFYRKQIRRGNGLIYNIQTKKCQISRKGLMKFYDISISSLLGIKNNDLDNISKKSIGNHNVVFQQILKILNLNKNFTQKQNKAKIIIHKLNKANGQNAQISYNQQTNQWIICSKNVSIFVQNKNDIKLYQQDRFRFACLIAQTWFNIIQNIGQKIQSLKNQLKDKTIIGQYCGNPQFQHLVKYSETTIYFYALVQKYTTQTCISPQISFQKFKQFNLPIVKNNEKSYIGTYTDSILLIDKMIQTYSQVARSSIFQQQQGSVIYFTVEQPQSYNNYLLNNNIDIQTVNKKVISLGKLKTLQYRILRKLRQKLKFFTFQQTQKLNQIQFNKKFQQKYAAFQRQCYQLVKSQKLQKKIQYYFCISLLSMEYGYKNYKNKSALQTMSNHYLDFLSVIFYCVQNKMQITTQLMADIDLHKKLRKQSWNKYGQQIVNQYQKILKRLMPKYAKIKNTINFNQIEKNQQHQKQQQF